VAEAGPLKQTGAAHGLRSHFESPDLERLRSTMRCLTVQGISVSPWQWLRSVLRSVRALTDSDKAALYYWAPGQGPAAYGEGVSQEALNAYLKRFAALDPARNRALASGLEVWSSSQVLDHWELERSEYYRAFVLPFRLHDTLGLSVRLPAQQVEIFIGLYAEHPSAPTLIQRRLSLLEVILPTFRLAVRAHLAGDDSLAHLASVIDVTGQALVLFDLEGRELRNNPVMRRVLAQDDQRDLLQGYIRQVAEAVIATLRPGEADPKDNRSDGTRREVATTVAAYRLRGKPVGRNALDHPSAVLVSLDRVAFEIPAPDSLRARYGLTVRELQVASLLMHRLSNKEIARMLSISPHTARHHTENVLTKLKVRSRKALRRLVAGGAPEPAT
jgi:DNA-binding CsgD family transcriptional regulator